MKVSVIIPTYNRANKVLHTVQALQIQRYTDFDIIVVVDGSQDATVEILTSFQSNKPLCVIDQTNSGRAVSRNAGAKRSDADLLIFYDDDTIPDRDSVARHVEFHLKTPTAAILGGNPVEYQEKKKTDFQNYKAFLCERWLAPYNNGYSRLTFDNLFLSGANFSIKRSAFNSLNGFSEFLTDNEDFDLGYRALENKLEVWFDYDNIAIHDDLISCKGYVGRLREYARSHAGTKSRYARVGPGASYPGMLKSFIYQIFSGNIWVSIIDHFNLFLILPKNIRYKLYDIITFSQAQKL
jgi:glycosyltransferase involved in cell wall biosynthesis